MKFKDASYSYTPRSGFKIIKVSLVNQSPQKGKYAEVIYDNENATPTVSPRHPSLLRFYDGKLVWTSSNLILNVLDVIGKSVCQARLESSKSSTRAYLLLPFEDMEKLGAFDIMIENAARTKYPSNMDSKSLYVVPSVVDANSITFDKQVSFSYCTGSII